MKGCEDSILLSMVIAATSITVVAIASMSVAVTTVVMSTVM